MDINKLKYFVEICKAKSISLAAENLYLTRQSLSQALKSLETELGTRLIKRNKTGIELTEEGQILYKSAEQIIMQWEATISNIKQARKKVIRVGFGLQSYNLWPMNNKVLFEEAHPNIQVEENVILPDISWQQLMNDSLDILATCVFPRNDTHIRTFLLCKMPTLCLMGKNHRLAGYDCIHPKDLQGEKVYEHIGVSVYDQEVRDFLKAEGVEAEYESFISTDIETICLTLSQGEGVWIASANYSNYTSLASRLCFKQILSEKGQIPNKDVYAIIKKSIVDDGELKEYICFLKKTITNRNKTKV